MRGKISIFLMAVLVASLCSLAALAQAEEQKAQPFYVRVVAVKPAEVKNYMSGIKEMVALETEHKFPYPIYASYTDDFHFYHAIPLKDGSIDNFWKAWGEFTAKIGPEQGQKIQKLLEGTQEYYKDIVVLSRPDLSYTPENPRLKPEEGNFLRWTFLYLHPGKQKEVEAFAKEYVALCKSKNIPDGYSLSEAIIGVEAPQYLIMEGAKNAADLYSQDKDLDKLLGEEGKALWKKAWPLIRKVEFKHGWVLPELSYIPKKEQTEK